MASLKYLLDTNICIYLMKEQPPVVLARFASCKIGEVALSAITWAELSCGMGTHNAHNVMMSLFSKLSPKPFDMDAAAMLGQLSQQFLRKRNSFDRMIAAHALALNVTLVTNNLPDFKDYQAAGLRLENWCVGN